jgi:carbon monoxide dehydrogenase subunit G
VITIDEEITVPAPAHEVWRVMSDPTEVVSCIDGAALSESHDDGSFDGVLVVKFSAMRVRFGARVTLDLDEPERRGRLSARGRDGQGATRFGAHADFAINDDGPGSTRVRVTGDVTLNGKLASIIEAGAGAVVTRMTRDFTDELTRRCAGQQPAADAAVTGQPTRWARLVAWLRRLLPTTRTENSGAARGQTQ